MRRRPTLFETHRGAMYRTIALLLLSSVTAAPQDATITYTTPSQTEPIPGETYSSTPIENIPLPTIRHIEEIPETSSDTIFQPPTTEEAERPTETTEAVTEKAERTTVYVKPKPKFYSKLSYFEKPDYSAVLTNLVEKPGRRRFRSRCRCEKISNCPKLQISVPRCPNEQFMCCF